MTAAVASSASPLCRDRGALARRGERVLLLVEEVQLLLLLLVVVVGVRSRVGLLLPAVELLLLKLPGPSRGGARGLERREGP